MSETNVANPVQSCLNKKDKIHDDAEIQSVEFLDGDDNTVLKGESMQYVNLPSEDRFVDPAISVNIDRLSRKPRIKVVFDKKGRHNFTIKLIMHSTPVDSNDSLAQEERRRNEYIESKENYLEGDHSLKTLTKDLESFQYQTQETKLKYEYCYTAEELARNDNFRHLEETLKLRTQSDGTRIIEGDVFLAVSGNDLYSVEAWDDLGNHKVSSGQLRSWRLIYFVEIEMENLLSNDADLEGVKQEFSENFVKLVPLDKKGVDYSENISTNIYDNGSTVEENIFMNKVKEIFSQTKASKKTPYCIAIVPVAQMANKLPKHTEISQMGRYQSIGSIIHVGLQSNLFNETSFEKHRKQVVYFKEGGLKKYLWQDIIKGEGWFISCKFIHNLGKDYEISESRCRPVPISKQLGHTEITRYDAVEVDLIDLKSYRINPEEGSIELIVNCVNDMLAGLTTGGTPVVSYCTKVWGVKIACEDQTSSLIHEIAHKFDMVPDGTRKLPDKTPAYYLARYGQTGPHCHEGLPPGQERYDNEGEREKSKCIMYENINLAVKFCDNCRMALRKIDLSGGFNFPIEPENQRF
jgi:type VI secretion system secreted protein VgrG